MEVIVSKAGFLTTVQDKGRTGQLQYGVACGGALDLHAARVVNTLVGNADSLGLLEITSGRVRLRFSDARVVAWVGGEYEVKCGEHVIPVGHSAVLTSEEEITFVGPNRGGRAWIALSGGVNVPPVLGSRATDLRANFGGWEGRALRDGDVLPLGENPEPATKLIRRLQKDKVSSWSAPFAWINPAARPALLRVVRGNHYDRFTPAANRALVTKIFPVSAQS